MGVNRLFAHLNRDHPIVLAFHGVTAEPPGHLCNHEGKHLHVPVFTRLMEHVAKHYHPVSLSRVVNWMMGQEAIPDRSVAVTFDDGYQNVLAHAAPVLKELGIPATLFVVTDFIFERRMLWPDRVVSALALTTAGQIQLRCDGTDQVLPIGSAREKIAVDARIRAVCKKVKDADRLAFIDDVIEKLEVGERALESAWPDHAPLEPEELPHLFDFGIDVGSHTCSHGIVSRFDADAMNRELVESRRLIETSTGRPCDLFSYPNGSPGDFDASTRAAVVSAGYRGAVTTIKRRVQRGNDPYEIPRCILTDNETTPAWFATEVSGYPGFLRAVKARMTGASPGRGSMV